MKIRFAFWFIVKSIKLVIGGDMFNINGIRVFVLGKNSWNAKQKQAMVEALAIFDRPGLEKYRMMVYQNIRGIAFIDTGLIWNKNRPNHYADKSFFVYHDPQKEMYDSPTLAVMIVRKAALIASSSLPKADQQQNALSMRDEFVAVLRQQMTEVTDAP